MNIQSIYKSISEEKSELKRRMNKIENKFSAVEKYMKYVADIKIAREQKKKIPLKKVVHDLGL